MTTGWNRSMMRGVLCLMLLSSLALSQVRKDKETDMKDMFEFALPEKTPPSISQPSGVALESTVNPEHYYVGPSDVIAVNIWMSPPLSFALTVTPEGTLIIPTVGEVPVTDMTLAQAKKKILAEVRKKYIVAEITATLVKPRPIIVNVVGSVVNPGFYTMTGVDRINRGIEEANKPSRTQKPADVAPIVEYMSTRNIVVRHKDGSTSRADVPKYLAMKEDSMNPYLREGDVVIVPKKEHLKNYIAVYGEVHAPGRQEFVDGDNLLDAVKMAQGTTARALTDSVVFSRMNPDGSSLTNRIINLNDIQSGRSANIDLLPGDRIVIKKKIEERGDYNVDVHGEVLYPGTYPITRNNTRLSDIIRQAGGFTEFASLRSAEVIRKSFLPEEEEIERLLSSRDGGSSGDSSGYNIETELRIQHENVSVDFEKLFTEKDTTQDIALQAEDNITIPSLRHTVYVFGQVASPGHVPYVKEREAKYYVPKAGGFTDRANKGGMKIIKAKTKQWLSPGETTIEDGDYIWIPMDIEYPFSYYMTIASQAASVLSVVMGVAILVVQVTK